MRNLSHPTRVRGLKLYMIIWVCLLAFVAPHAGAWIETRLSSSISVSRKSSHPTRVRGLKHSYKVALG